MSIELNLIKQTSGDLCHDCGWRGRRGAGCAFCQLEIAMVGLNQIAAWDEGAEVTGSFDEPHAATAARETLKKIGET